MATTEMMAGAPTLQPYAPRSRKRTKAGRFSHEITYQELESCFHLPTEQACKRLGVGLTILKRICRRFGLPRWPYKKPTKSSYAQRVSEVPAGGAYGGYAAAPAPVATPVAAPYHPSPSPFSWPHHPAPLAGMNLGWGSLPPPAPQPSELSRPLPRRAAAGDPAMRALAAVREGREDHPSNESDTDRLNLLLHAIEQSEGEDGDSDVGGVSGAAAPSPRSPVSVNDTLQDATNAGPAGAAEGEKAAAAALLSQALAHLGSNAADDSKSAAVVTLVDVLATNPTLAQQLAAVLAAATGPAPAPVPAPAPRADDLAAAMHAELRKLQDHHRAQQAAAAAAAAAAAPAADPMAGHLRALQDMQRQFAATQGVPVPGPNPSMEAAELAARLHAAQTKAAARQVALQRLHAHMAMRDAVAMCRGGVPAYEVAPAPAPMAPDQASLLQLLAAKLAQQG